MTKRDYQPNSALSEISDTESLTTKAQKNATSSKKKKKACKATIGATPVVQLVKNVPANAGDTRDTGSSPRSGRFLGESNGNPLQYSCPENSTNTGALGVEESDMIEHTHTTTTKAAIRTWSKALLCLFPGIDVRVGEINLRLLKWDGTYSQF